MTNAKTKKGARKSIALAVEFGQLYPASRYEVDKLGWEANTGPEPSEPKFYPVKPYVRKG